MQSSVGDHSSTIVRIPSCSQMTGCRHICLRAEKWAPRKYMPINISYDRVSYHAKSKLRAPIGTVQFYVNLVQIRWDPPMIWDKRYWNFSSEMKRERTPNKWDKTAECVSFIDGEFGSCIRFSCNPVTLQYNYQRINQSFTVVITLRLGCNWTNSPTSSL